MRCLVSIYFLLSMVATHAQKQGQALVDSLELEIPRAVSDTDRAKLYMITADRYIDINLDKSLLLADSGAALAEKAKWQKGIAAFQLIHGNVYNFRGDYRKAIDFFTPALENYRTMKETRRAAAVLSAMGKSYEGLSDYGQAARYHFEALRLHETIPRNDLFIGNCYSSIAVLYFNQHDFAKSLDYSKKAIEKQTLAGNKTGTANELCNMADTYYELKDSVHATAINLKANDLYKALGNKQGQAVVMMQLGKLNAQHPGKSLAYLYEAATLFDAIGNNDRNAVLNKGEVGKTIISMIKTNQPDLPAAMYNGLPKTRATMLQLAEKYLQEAIATSNKNGNKDDASVLLARLADVEALSGNYKQAYANVLVHQQLQDSIFSQDNKNKIAAIEGSREILLRDKEIEIKQLTIASQQKQRIVFIAGILLLGLVGTLLYWQNTKRKKTNAALHVVNKQLEEANKVKAKFFAIVSHDLRGPVARLISFLHLQQEESGMLTEQQAVSSQHRITQSAENLLETMESMLLWSKGQMENFTPEIKPVPVSGLFDYLQHFFKGVENVRMVFDNPGDLVTDTDDNYLKTIMHNLTSNAIKALNNTAAAAIVWTALRTEEAILLTIADNGPGLTPAQASALQDDATIGGYKNGLGLLLIRDLAKAIHCTITYHSVPGKGTTFRLQIPLLPQV